MKQMYDVNPNLIMYQGSVSDPPLNQGRGVRLPPLSGQPLSSEVPPRYEDCAQNTLLASGGLSRHGMDQSIRKLVGVDLHVLVTLV